MEPSQIALRASCGHSFSTRDERTHAAGGFVPDGVVLFKPPLGDRQLRYAVVRYGFSL
jgi:hypothetical protein